ncbi:MAG: sensor histidine kinase [Clostridia bacterium]
MSKSSVKFKIVLLFTVFTVLIVSACSGILLYFQRQTVNDVVENRMIVSMNAMEEKVEIRLNDMLSKGYISQRHTEAPQKMRYYEKGVHYLLYNNNKELIGAELPFAVVLSNSFENEGFRYEVYDNDKYYIFDRKIILDDGSEYWLKGVFPATNEEYAFDVSRKYNIILAVILILLASIGGYLMLGKLLNPINKIVDTANEIASSSDISKRINIGKRNDEIGHLANTFDEMLDKIEKLVDKEKQFTSDVSHELRTPITVMLSECEFMKECERGSTDFENSLNMVERQAKKMSTLVTELLTLSRMDKNKIVAQFEKTDISELLNFICDEQEKIQSGKIKLIRDIDDKVYANIDRALVSRLFVNLITNAYKYNKKIGSVTVKLKETDEDIVFSVKDTGIGISEEDLPKIWERFYQVDRARSYCENGSSGLGLSMVKWIANALGGEVYAQSELGKGSIFTFKLIKKMKASEVL